MICVQNQSSRGVLQKDALQTWSKSTEKQPFRSAILTKLLCNFIEITPTDECAPENLQHVRKQPLPGEYFWGTVSVCQKSFKRLKLYKKLSFTIFKKIYSHTKLD